MKEATGTMYNSLVVLNSDGPLLGVRRKLIPTNIERLFYTDGTGKDMHVFALSLSTVGGLMCESIQITTRATRFSPKVKNFTLLRGRHSFSMIEMSERRISVSATGPTHLLAVSLWLPHQE